jgi:hypothetical protein
MKDLILTTTFRRPEMLWLCLENISACPEYAECDHQIWVDSHQNEQPHPDLQQVLKHFSPLGFSVYQADQTSSDAMNSLTLTILVNAYRSDYRDVILVEEDIMVARDFLRYTRAVLDNFDCWCSVGSGHIGTDIERIDFSNHFSPWGVGWKREDLRYFVEHAKPEYYQDIYGYVAKTFPGTGPNDAAWDGLANRLVKVNNFKVAFPHVPRCFHAGIYGQYRTRTSRLQDGPLAQKVNELRERFQDPAWMTLEYADCAPCDLGDKPWERLRYGS